MAAALVTVPVEPVTTTRKAAPLSVKAGEARVYDEVVAPAMLTPLRCHWYRRVPASGRRHVKGDGFADADGLAGRLRLDGGRGAPGEVDLDEPADPVPSQVVEEAVLARP